MKWHIIKIIAVAILLLPVKNIPGQTTEPSGSYERKSISYIPAVYIPRSEAYQLHREEIDYLINSIRESIEMPRFDFNPLPEEITDNLIQQARRQGNLSLENLEGMLTESIVPVIVDILNTEMEIRARDLVSEEQKQQFIATKAQGYGITAGQLETVMNSAYLYIPYVDDVSFKEDDGMITFHITGGLFWYHIETLGDEPKVESLLKQESFSMGQGLEKRSYSYHGRSLNGEEFSLYTAIDNFARNLQVATQSIPVFKLSGLIQYTGGRDLQFDLGRKEGIMVDDGFFVGEQTAAPDGSVEMKHVGFIRTVAVGNNAKDAYDFSQAKTVFGGDFAQGMSVIEHPRLPIDIVIRPRIYQMEVTAGAVGVEWSGSGANILQARFTDAYSGPTVGLDFEANYHIGRWFDVPMLLMGVGGTFSPVPVTIEIQSFQSAVDQTIPVLYQLHFGLAKKYFYKRLGWVLSAKFGAAVLSATKKVVDLDGDEHTISLSNRTGGTILQMGLEYVVTPDFYLGGYAGYQMFPRSPIWTFDVDHDSYPLITGGSQNLPQFSSTGYTVGIYFHYQPPALPFDPLNWIRGVSGL